MSDAELIEANPFMSNLHEMLVEELNGVLGTPVFNDGRAANNAPDILDYEMIAIWNHGGHQKYLAWVRQENHAAIALGKMEQIITTK